MPPDSRHIDFYKPLKSSKASSRGGSSSNSFSSKGVDTAAATSVQLGMGGRSSSINSYSTQNIEAPSASQTNPSLNPNILNQYRPITKPTLNNIVAPSAPTNVDQRQPSQSQHLRQLHLRLHQHPRHPPESPPLLVSSLTNLLSHMKKWVTWRSSSPVQKR